MAREFVSQHMRQKSSRVECSGPKKRIQENQCKEMEDINLFLNCKTKAQLGLLLLCLPHLVQSSFKKKSNVANVF